MILVDGRGFFPYLSVRALRTVPLAEFERRGRLRAARVDFGLAETARKRPPRALRAAFSYFVAPRASSGPEGGEAMSESEVAPITLSKPPRRGSRPFARRQARQARQAGSTASASSAASSSSSSATAERCFSACSKQTPTLFSAWPRRDSSRSCASKASSSRDRAAARTPAVTLATSSSA